MASVTSRARRGRVIGTSTSAAIVAACLAFIAAPRDAAAAVPAPQHDFIPADPSNYRAYRNSAIDRVVIHTTEGSKAGTISWFRNPSSNVSAHYVVGLDGSITQMVNESYRAWHCGNWNDRSIGIEHEGYAHRNTWTDAQVRASAHLTAWICERYGIPVDRVHLVGHVEVPGATHTDPGPYFDWARYQTLIRQHLGAAPPPPPPPTYAARFVRASMPARMTEGDTAIVWVEYENTGTATWRTDATRLGTQEPQDRSSPFYTDYNWIGANRPTPVDTGVAPGATGRFTWIMTAPNVSQTTSYTEAFRPVQEHVTWFGDTRRFTIEVVPVAPPPPPPPPTAAPVEIVTVPARADVLLDGGGSYPGRFVGKSGDAGAPLTVTLEPGRHVLRLRAPRHDDAIAVVTVGSGGASPARVEVALRYRTPETFARGRAVDAGGAAYQASGGRAAPVITDWDADGKADVVVGNADGRVDVLRNASATSLDLAVPVAVSGPGGGPLSVGGDAVPFVADWDNDGLDDLIVGDAAGRVRVFKNTGSAGAPAFGAAATRVQVNGAPFTAPGGRAAPWVADIDGDHRKDLLVGAGDGRVLLLRNAGSDDAPSFMSADPIGPALGSPVRPQVADLDQDGRPDLIIGAGGGRVVSLANVGSPSMPAFGAPADLRWFANEASGAIAAAASAAPVLGDVNGDGRRDLIVGAADGSLTFHRSRHIAGDIDDGKRVEGRDLIGILRAHGTSRGDARFSPEADVDRDGDVDDADLTAARANLGRTY